MDECSTWRFNDSHAMSPVIFAGIENICAEEIGIFTQHTNSFNGKQGFNQTCIVIIQRVFYGLAVIQALEDFQLFIRQRCVDLFSEVESSQWTDAVDAIGVS